MCTDATWSFRSDVRDRNNLQYRTIFVSPPSMKVSLHHSKHVSLYHSDYVSLPYSEYVSLPYSEQVSSLQFSISDFTFQASEASNWRRFTSPRDAWRRHKYGVILYFQLSVFHVIEPPICPSQKTLSSPVYAMA